ncbi:hypothetical protein QOL99_01785 [Deinococcus sp. MIMF12]|uniref:Uncharacterized protein n=1 Tax=Deinococcus rhizophilus TaxID=3049544 RepID=A0ABT7JE82_9DEIO|nr:hypothetical protein [Deinococcus rhizophilus]MDL2342872.1 hypothetical protein [Deinococcus rhizophilus]
MPPPVTQALHRSLLAHDTITVLARSAARGGPVAGVERQASQCRQPEGGLRLRAQQLLAASGVPEGLARNVLNDLELAQCSTRPHLSRLWDERLAS